MAEFQKIMRQLNRLCLHYQYCSDCPMYDECGNIGAYCSEPKHSYRIEKTVMAWAAENPEPKYPTWMEYLVETQPDCVEAYNGGNDTLWKWMWETPIPADIAEKLGIRQKENK